MKNFQISLAVILAKILTQLVKTFKLGAGSVLPGQIAQKIYPQILPALFQQARKGVILIVGTNGKTTTSLLIRSLLESQGYQICHNATGANLINGLITALIGNTNLWGRLEADYAILEVDENILPLLLKTCTPHYILALNLFRDQLDRYGEVDVISQRWKEAIAPLPQETVIVLNADDPTLSHLGQQLSQKVIYFGLNETELYLDEIPHAVDSIYCPKCGHPLSYKGVYLSHLGDFVCSACGFQRSEPFLHSRDFPQILIGVYNKYNTLASVTLAQAIGIETPKMLNTIQSFKAAFGRAEELTLNGKKIRILLAKNPVGMNETIRTLKDIQKDCLSPTTLVVLNDRTPDGTDVSWIWDVDTEKLTDLGGTIIVSGDRVYDMALRLNYSQSSLENKSFELIIEEDLHQSIDLALAQTKAGDTLHIVPTYSAMLEVRQILTGRGIL